MRQSLTGLLALLAILFPPLIHAETGSQTASTPTLSPQPSVPPVTSTPPPAVPGAGQTTPGSAIPPPATPATPAQTQAQTTAPRAPADIPTAGHPNEKPDPVPPEGIKEDLERAQRHFLEGLRALGDAGRRTLDENVPIVQEKTRKTVEETKKLMQDWEGQLHKLEQNLSPPPKAAPPAPAMKNTDSI
ncbi:MAG: hypothetical protein HQL66_00330 [Magnetococcales bacterium]|nr:hypothetical protein [Magnetococcales bacterium]